MQMAILWSFAFRDGELHVIFAMDNANQQNGA